jgi:hypothetical protein
VQDCTQSQHRTSPWFNKLSCKNAVNDAQIPSDSLTTFIAALEVNVESGSCFRQSRSWFGIYPLTLTGFTKSSSTIVLGKPISASRKCIKESSIPIFKLDRELDLRTYLMVESQISNAPRRYFTAGSETKSLSMPS